MRNVVRSTSHSEMPSTPSLKWMPNAATHSLSTTWFHCVGSKSPSMNSDVAKVTSEMAKAKPRKQALFLARHQQAQERAEQRQERRQGQQHYCTFTVRDSRGHGAPARVDRLDGDLVLDPGES